MFRYLPEQASEAAPTVDAVNNLITDLSVFFTVAIVGAMIYFAIRYRRRPGDSGATPQIHGSLTLEVLWTVIPTIISIFVMIYGLNAYRQVINVDDPNPVIVNVTGQKWFWTFRYENGKETTGHLTVPVDRGVKLILQSRDVIHSFFIPAMRVKKDAVPNRLTYVTFRPVKTGDYNVFCTEYCGTNHSGMLATMSVLPAAEYDRWLNDRSAEMAAQRMTPAERGERIYKERGCNACHSINGTPLVGPTFLGIYEREGKLADGSSYKADEDYIRSSIYAPQSQTVAGFETLKNTMPVFTKEQIPEDGILDIIAYMKSLKPPAEGAAAGAPAGQAAVDRSKLSPAERGKLLFTEKSCVGCHSLDGSKLVGPTFKGLYGHKVPLTDGTEVTADDAYITESIKNPTAKVVKDFPPAMPPLPVSDDEIKDIIEFIKTVE